MLLKFKHMKTREAILEQLLTKFDLIMQQFSKEVSSVEHAFTVSFNYRVSQFWDTPKNAQRRCIF